MATDQRRGFKQIAQAARWSIHGLKATFKYEASFRLEVYLAAILTPCAFFIAQSPLQLLLLFACMFIVLIVEIINSAIEAIVDMVCKDRFHELAKRAKDMGSAAVFLTQLLMVYTWSTVIYVNYR